MAEHPHGDHADIALEGTVEHAPESAVCHSGVILPAAVNGFLLHCIAGENVESGWGDAGPARLGQYPGTQSGQHVSRNSGSRSTANRLTATAVRLALSPHSPMQGADRKS